jgi:predicted MFS family arabinose efflux permease
MTAHSALILSSLISCIGFFMAVSYFNSMFHGVSGSSNRSGRMAIHESLISSGLILGSVIGGFIYQRFSMTYVYLFCAAFLLFGTVLQGMLCLKPFQPRNLKG